MPTLFIAPNWLGDAVLALGALRRLVSEEPDALVAVREHLSPVFDGYRTVPLPTPRRRGTGRQGLRLMEELGSGTIHRAFVLAPSVRAALLARASGAKERVGYGGRRRLRKMLLTHPLQRPPRTEHQWSHYLGVIEASLGRGGRPLPRIEAPPAYLDRPRRPLVVFCPGARYGPAKRWPVTRFAQLAARLAGDTGAQVAVAGTKDDVWAERAIAAHVPGGIIRLVGKTDLPQLMGLLAQADAVVSNDSGAMHLAAALGTPVVGLFGSSTPTWTGPLGERHLTFYHPPSCSPCYEPVCRFEHYTCLQAIAVGEVLEAVASLLQTGGPAP